MNARPGSARRLVVHEDGVLADVGDVDDAGPSLAVEHHALLAVGAEADRLAVHERDQHVVAVGLAGDGLERAVVEDVAVLVDLDERGALVVVGPPEHLHHVLAVHVVGAGHERGLGAERHADRVERVVERAERRRLGDLADLAASASTGPWSGRRSGC